MDKNTLEGAATLNFQTAVIFHISLLSEDGVPTGVMVAGNGEARSACVYGNQLYPALVEIDHALDKYQENNPDLVLIEICSDEVMEAMNLLLESKQLHPISQDEFNFSDTLLWIGNPVLARQMGHGL